MVITGVIPVADDRDESYWVRIRDASGKEIWKGDGFKVDYDRTRLGLSRRFLPAGVYTISVLAEEDASESIVDHSIEIRYLAT